MHAAAGVPATQRESVISRSELPVSARMKKIPFEPCGMEWDGVGWDGMRRDGMDGMRWDGIRGGEWDRGWEWGGVKFNSSGNGVAAEETLGLAWRWWLGRVSSDRIGLCGVVWGWWDRNWI